jgi:Lrp/AsnC family transcriptional regulator, leucine-responsive regulatory protein
VLLPSYCDETSLHPNAITTHERSVDRGLPGATNRANVPTNRQRWRVTRIDELDRALVRLLTSEARLTMAELGRRVGLSRTATLARIRRLEDLGVIRGYHAEVRLPEQAAAHAARVGIVVRTTDVLAYVRRLMTLPEVREVETLAGEYDLLVRICADSAAHLDEILDRINGWRETQRTTTWVVLNTYLAKDRPFKDHP